MYVYRLMKPSEIKSTLVSRTVRPLWAGGLAGDARHPCLERTLQCCDPAPRQAVGRYPPGHLYLHKQVYVLWPDEEQANATWYRARVDECKVASKKGDLYYEDTDELETGADLADLVYQGHIAFRESAGVWHRPSNRAVCFSHGCASEVTSMRRGRAPFHRAGGATNESSRDSHGEITLQKIQPACLK